jgi:hypothetical protein
VRKRKEEWMLTNDVGIGDVRVRAEELLDAAQAAPVASDLRARQTLDAACLALSIVAPRRIGDLHRIRIGKHLKRHADGWRLSILTAKTELAYDRTRLCPEVTPFLDAVILLDAPGGEFWAGYEARCAPSTALFSGDGGRTGYDELSPTKVWIRHFEIGAHIIRSLWHQLMFECEDDEQYVALALCGHGGRDRPARHRPSFPTSPLHCGPPRKVGVMPGRAIPMPRSSKCRESARHCFRKPSTTWNRWLSMAPGCS